MNFQDTAGITILSSKIAAILHITPRTFTMNMALYTLILFILGVGCVCLCIFPCLLCLSLGIFLVKG